MTPTLDDVSAATVPTVAPNAPGTPRRTIRVPDDEWAAAMAKAGQRGESLPEEIRKFLRRYAKKV